MYQNSLIFLKPHYREEKLITALLFTADCGLPLKRNNVKNMVQSYVKASKKNTPFNCGRPGPEWMKLFEQRHCYFDNA